MPKFKIEEIQTVYYTVDAPDKTSAAALLKADLNARQLLAPGCKTVIADRAEIRHFISPCDANDHEPAEVQLDDQLKQASPKKGLEESPAVMSVGV